MTLPTIEDIERLSQEEIALQSIKEYNKKIDEKKKATGGIDFQAEELSEKDKNYYRKNISKGPIPEFELVVNGKSKQRLQKKKLLREIKF